MEYDRGSPYTTDSAAIEKASPCISTLKAERISCESSVVAIVGDDIDVGSR